MLMQLYKNENIKDYTYEEILNNKRFYNGIRIKISKYIRVLQYMGIEKDDIESEINLSLWKAYKTFNPKQAVFSTYVLNVIINDMNRLLNYYSRDKRNRYDERYFISIYSIYEDVIDSMMAEEMIDNGDTRTEVKYLVQEYTKIIENYYDNADEYNKDLVKYMCNFIRLEDIVNKYGKYKQYHLDNVKKIRKYLIDNNKILQNKNINHENTNTIINKKVKIIEDGQLLGVFKDLKVAKAISEQAFNIKLYDINVYLMLSKFSSKG